MKLCDERVHSKNKSPVNKLAHSRTGPSGRFMITVT